MESMRRRGYEELLRGTPYRALAHLASGGMGEIYEAVEVARGERVVVKLLRPELAWQRDYRDRMRVEGETIALLSHPHIVAGRGHGVTADELPYVAMERLYGTTLREELRSRGAFPVGEAVHHTRQLLSALRAVHEAGLVHRDVKPDNVMVCDRGGGGTRVKLLDFGIAKVKISSRARILPLVAPTRTGLCVGTPRYVAPEQASGAIVDPRTDIYGAGLLLYTLVAGRGPFDDIKGAEHLLRAHQEILPPPPSSVAPDAIPAALESVILRAIAKNPEHRFADAAAFARALDLVAPSLRERRGTARSDFAMETDPTVRQFSFAQGQAKAMAGFPFSGAPHEAIKRTVLLTACVRRRRLVRLARWFWGTGLIFVAAATGAVIGALAMWWLA